MQTKTITYRELARRVGDMILCNKITEIEEDFFDHLESGELDYCEKHDDVKDCTEKCEEQTRGYKEIYQYYLIMEGGADYLKRYTNEIVLFSPKLEVYVWGITHFGTSWDGVEVQLKNNTCKDCGSEIANGQVCQLYCKECITKRK